jgi:hypothetical protein
MPPTHKNVNASYRLDQVAFLQHLAACGECGDMSRLLRKLLDGSEEFRDWQKSHQSP